MADTVLEKTSDEALEMLPLACRLCGLAKESKCDLCPTPSSRWRRAIARLTARYPEVPYVVVVVLALTGLAVGLHP